MEEAEEKGDPIGGPADSINLDPLDPSNTETPNRQHTPGDIDVPNTHIVEDFRDCVNSEMMHLTCKRLEAPGI